MEFETYGDVIDAFERDNMGYETLTDYIRGENIKIAEIDMSPMGDLAKAFNKKDGGMMIAIEQLGKGGITGGKTYHQYHDQFVPPDSESEMYANGGGVGSMMQPKNKNFKIQGGVKNYRPSEMVTAPKIAKSSPETPTAKLAYITPEEENILVDLNLYGSLKGKPNRGPSGLPSLEGDFGGPGGFGGFRGGGDYSSAETGNFSGFDGTPSGPALPPGVTPKPSKEAQAIRNAAIVAGAGQRVNPGFFDSRNTISPQELALARASNPKLFNKVRGTGGIMGFIKSGGIFGNLLRGLGQMFGLGKTYDQPTYDMSEFNKLGLGGVDPFANLDIRDKFDRRKTNVINQKPTANITGTNLNDFQMGDPGKYATADMINEFGTSPQFDASLVNEFGTSDDFNTSLVNEFGVKDRGTFDANEGLQYGSIPGTSDQGFGLMNSDAAKAAAMSVMSNAFNENVMPGTSDMGFPDRNMNFPDTGMLVADASKNTNQQMLENIINKDMYEKNLQPAIDNQNKKKNILEQMLLEESTLT
jgi:hypothetical protein